MVAPVHVLGDALRGRKVLLTGHTGFKGAWLAFWLHKLGAKIHGFALPENPAPGAYTALGIRQLLASEKLADLRETNAFALYYSETKPDLVFHLGAQALVRESYREPIATLQTNFMGTAHVLETLRLSTRKCACIVVTSDKCYENRETGQAYSEIDAMGGHDVYSMSKGACELLVASYRRSFNLALASARAGNVIGGGDYAEDRIVPDCVRALNAGRKIAIRNPDSTRPWQHVFEPLSGYLSLAEKLLGSNAASFCEAWNFGPRPDEVLTVRNFVDSFVREWGSGGWESLKEDHAPHEAQLLRLNIDKSAARLGWQPTWDANLTIHETVEWYRQFERSAKTEGCMRDFSLRQLEKFNGR